MNSVLGWAGSTFYVQCLVQSKIFYHKVNTISLRGSEVFIVFIFLNNLSIKRSRDRYFFFSLIYSSGHSKSPSAIFSSHSWGVSPSMVQPTLWAVPRISLTNERQVLSVFSNNERRV